MRRFLSIMDGLNRLTGITLVILVGGAVSLSQWYGKSVGDPHIRTLADSVFAEKHAPYEKRLDSIEVSRKKKDSLQCLLFFMVYEMATNDQKIKAEIRMEEMKGFFP